MPVRDPLYETSPYAPSDVVTNAFALLLGKGCEQRQEEFSVLGCGINVLALESDGDPLLFQPSNGMKAIHGIAGKAADAFDEHQINLPGVAIRDQPLELRSMRVLVPVMPSSAYTSAYSHVGFFWMRRLL